MSLCLSLTRKDFHCHDIAVCLFRHRVILNSWFKWVSSLKCFLNTRNMYDTSVFNNDFQGWPWNIYIILRQNGSFCISSTTCMRRGTLVNAQQRVNIIYLIFVFFVHKKYSHSFITLQLNKWCHMDYFIYVLPFWALNVSVAVLSIQGQKALGFHQKYLNLCSEDEWRSYGFGTTWGWVINDRFFIFWVNFFFKISGKTWWW